MHALAHGDVQQRLRLVTGLILFTFAATHFFNHALGLVSLEAMDTLQGWRKVVTRSWPGSVILLSAFLTHILLGLYKISRRLTWRLPFWEAAQIATGLSIPLFLITHVVFNRGAASLAGTDDSYAFELANIWPALALEHSVLLLCVWVHGCIGIHYWLSLAPWYPRVRQALFALAVALPVTALAGFSVAGRQVALQVAPPGATAKLQAHTHAPDAATEARLVALRNGLQLLFLTLLGLALLVPVVRIVRRATGARIEVTYRGGPTVRVAPGPTLLEISRMRDVPHASVCGGRARCSTCRVGVESGLEALAAPSAAEAMTLARINAPSHVRLACQIRPVHSITVTRLVAPPVHVARQAGQSNEAQGVERNLAVLFFDTRGFTAISEARLPYDVVFILNRLFAEVGEAIRSHHGKIDKYLGDGLMAIFGAEAGEAAGCRQALGAARDIDLALDRLNEEIIAEVGQPLRIGMGIDVGPLVVGHIGHAETAMITVIGTTVNAASRLEALTKEKACQLIASVDVLTHAGLSPDVFPREEVAIRGLSAPRAVALIDKARNLPPLPQPAKLARQDAPARIAR
ncbi:MAG: 2Fe-2S iron-sulfur cluster binding domain-containing protein [Hyphomonadaceae bacterium]|nr:2Fe-2S iron-sulfur cluster binding domain-containing protein [Hyphomonadaceae bacterium]